MGRGFLAAVFLFAVLFLSVGGASSTVHAAGLTGTQIASILNLLQSFGADQSVIDNVGASLRGQSSSGTPSSCVDLSYNLASGSTDARTRGDITRLQQFLGVNTTGYFGPLTEQAVQDWQSSNNLLSAGSPDTNGFGYVGAKTRKAMGCGNHSQSNVPTIAITSPLPAQGSNVPTNVPTIAITSPLPAQGSVDVFLRIPSKYANSFVVYILNPIEPSQPVSSGTLLGMAYNSSGKDVDGFTAHLSVASAHQGFATNQGGVHRFPVPSGKYRLTAVLYPSSPFKPGSDMEYMDIGTEPGALTYVDSQPFDIMNNTTGIRVTAPNGGEGWQEGVLNTVTWSPYQYNPDSNPAKDVTAYLEKKNSDGTFSTLGKVQESGKASIHWITGELNSTTQGGNLAPTGGGYYVRVVNNVTGATDRSDAPFTLLPNGGVIKVNGSDGPLTLVKDQKVNVSWSSYNTNSCWISGLKSTQGGSDLSIPHVSSNGNQDAYYSGLFNIILVCQKNTGGEINDVIAVNTSSSSSIRIVSPNGGENIEIGKKIGIEYHLEGIKSISIALYKNDTWQKWIVKDSFIGDSGSTNMGFSWTPDEAQTYGSKVYKIYVTGQKADGTGYVDDKSDAPFGFTAYATSTLTVTNVSLPYIYISYTNVANTEIDLVSQSSGSVVHNQGIFGTSGTATIQVQQSLSPGYYFFRVLKKYGGGGTLVESAPFQIGTSGTRDEGGGNGGGGNEGGGN